MASTQTHKIRQVQQVGRRIRKLRKQRKLTQTALSARIGIQQSDLSRMEKGEYRVSLDTLFRILAEFDMSVGEFFEDMARETLSPTDTVFLDRFHSLPGEAQREVREFVQFKRAQERASRNGGSGR